MYRSVTTRRSVAGLRWGATASERKPVPAPSSRMVRLRDEGRGGDEGGSERSGQGGSKVGGGDEEEGREVEVERAM